MKGYAAEDFKVKAGSRRNRNLKDKMKSGHEKPLGPVVKHVNRSQWVEIDDETVIDLKSIRSLRDIPAED